MTSPNAIPLGRDDLTVYDPDAAGATRTLTDAEWQRLSDDLVPTDRHATAAALNDDLVTAAGEPRDPDEYVAALQDDRDRCAARGDFERAEALNAQVQDLRHPQLPIPAQRSSEPVTLSDVDQVAAQERADRQDPGLARVMNARDHEAAGGRFDVADASQRLIDHMRAAAAVRAVQQAGLPTAARGRDAGMEQA